MADYENLKGKGFESRTTEEVREIARKGGINSGIARRKKRDMKASINMLMELPVTDKLKAKLQALGVEEWDANYQTGVLVAMLQEALKGNVRAAQFIIELMGESPRQNLSEKEYELQKQEFEYKKSQGEKAIMEDPYEDALSASLRELAERGLESD